MSEDARVKLEPLRTELGQIDRDILALVAERQALAQQIGQVKRDAGIPTRDYRQERDVVERARAAAVEHGLSPTLGEELDPRADSRLADGSGEGHGRGERRGQRPARARDRRLGPHGPLVRALPRGAGLHRRERGSAEPPVRHGNITYHRGLAHGRRSITS